MRGPVLLPDGRCPVGDLGARLTRVGVLSNLSVSSSRPILARISCTIELVCAAVAAVALDSLADAAVESAMLSFLLFGGQFVRLVGRPFVPSHPVHAASS